MSGDDDWPVEWEDDGGRTVPDEAIPDPILDTAKHRSHEFLGGREAGFSDGVNATIRALSIRMKMRGSSDAEIALETGAVRAMAEDLG